MSGDINSTNSFLKLKRALQDFQSNRINATYKDIETDPEFSKIGDFFFKKLYAPEEFSLKTVKTTAAMFGIKEIIDFIYDGYVAFKAIDNIDFFVETMTERELAWHNEIWSNVSEE
jgi:hypothetical protein